MILLFYNCTILCFILQSLVVRIMEKAIQQYRNLICLWFKLPEKIRYVFVGGFNFLVSYIMFVFLSFLFYGIGREFVHDILTGIKMVFPTFEIDFWFFLRQFILAGTWFASSFISFGTQRYLTFKSKSPIVKSYLKCLLGWAVGYLINAVVLEVMIFAFSFTSMHPLLEMDLSQFFANAFAAISSYIFFKYYAFRKNKQANISAKPFLLLLLFLLTGFICISC